MITTAAALVLASFFIFASFSEFNHNRYGIVINEYDATVTANMEDVKSNFNRFDGILLDLGEDSEVTLNNVEASYNSYDLDGESGYSGVYAYADASPAVLILKGTNSVIGNKDGDGYGFYADDINVVVSRGATLNAYNNTGNGVQLAGSTPTLTVKKGGAVNVCGNDVVDLVGSGSSSFFPSDGKRYTCDDVVDNGSGFSSCENPCPVCALN